MRGPFRSTPRSLNEGVEANVAGDMLAVPAPTWGNLVDFLQPGQTDRHAEWFLSPFQHGERYDKRMLLFLQRKEGNGPSRGRLGRFSCCFPEQDVFPKTAEVTVLIGKKAVKLRGTTAISELS